jgi:hypothetical protein
MPNKLSRTTTDHEEIQRWAESRGAQPAEVEGTERGGDDVGIIRLDFPGYTGTPPLRHISWDEWFRKFDESGLALVYQERTSGGQRSNFNKLVARETAEARKRGDNKASRRSLRGRSGSRTGARSSRGGAAARSGRQAARRRTGGRKAASGRPGRTSSRRTGSRGAARRSTGARGGARTGRIEARVESAGAVARLSGKMEVQPKGRGGRGAGGRGRGKGGRGGASSRASKRSGGRGRRTSSRRGR